MTSINSSGPRSSPIALGSNPPNQKTSETPTSSTLQQPRRTGHPTGDSFGDIAAAPASRPGTLQAEAKRFTEEQLKAGISVLEKLGTGFHINAMGSNINGDGIATLSEVERGHRNFTNQLETTDGSENLMKELKKHGINVTSTDHLYGIRDVVDFLHKHRKAIAETGGNGGNVSFEDIRAMRQKNLLKSPPLNLHPVSQSGAQPAATQLKPIIGAPAQRAGGENPPGFPRLSLGGQVYEFQKPVKRDLNDGEGLREVHSYKSTNSDRRLIYDPMSGKVWQSVQNQQGKE